MFKQNKHHTTTSSAYRHTSIMCSPAVTGHIVDDTVHHRLMSCSSSSSSSSSSLSSLLRLLVILQRIFWAEITAQEWFAIAFSWDHFTFVRSLFWVFSSISIHHFFLSCTVSFKTSNRSPVASLVLSNRRICGFPYLLYPATCPSIIFRSSDPFALMTWPK